MKKLVPILVVFCLLFAFFSCDDKDDGKVTYTAITLDKVTHTMEANEVVFLTAETTPAGGPITWESSDPAVASVSTNGRVDGLGIDAGEVTISAKITGSNVEAATCVITLTAATKNIAKIEDGKLVHYSPRIAGVSHFGGDLGTTNADGTYTFDSTANEWSGGGAGYVWPTPRASDTWQISQYATAEIFYTITNSANNFQAKLAKGSSSDDLTQYPSGSQYLTLPNGTYTAKVSISNAGSGISFQRRSGGPATIQVTKVVFEKLPTYTISFTGGTNTAMTPHEISVFEGGKVSLTADLPPKPKFAGNIFKGFKDTVNSADWNIDFFDTVITKNYTFVAQWEAGTEVPVDMNLDLNPDNWPTLPTNTNGILTGGVVWPADFAETEYDEDSGTLKVTFNGKNRQRAIFPLSDVQIEELLLWTKNEVTFKLDVEVKDDEGNVSDAGFRCHLVDPSVAGGWNGTDTGSRTALKDRLQEKVTFTAANKSKSTLAWFAIQAMYYDEVAGSPDVMDKDFPIVVMTFTSIAIEPGNTLDLP